MSKALWSADEDDVIRDLYRHGGATACKAALTDRTVCAIHGRAYQLGVKMSREAKSEAQSALGKARASSGAWTDEELQIVRRCYPRGGVAAVHAVLPARTPRGGLHISEPIDSVLAMWGRRREGSAA